MKNQAARRFFRKLLKGEGRSLNRVVTDTLGSYAAAKRELMLSVVHWQDCYEYNRAEVSHEHTREQERQTRGFKSPGQAQRFLSVHARVQNLFRVGRHRRCVSRRYRYSRRKRAWTSFAPGKLSQPPARSHLRVAAAPANRRAA